MALAVETCSGWDFSERWYDALGEPRCVCGYSWATHRQYGRPLPTGGPPPWLTDEEVAALFAEDEALGAPSEDQRA